MRKIINPVVFVGVLLRVDRAPASVVSLFCICLFVSVLADSMQKKNIDFEHNNRLAEAFDRGASLLRQTRLLRCMHEQDNDNNYGKQNIIRISDSLCETFREATDP
jgi:hypothetical protein